MNVDQNDNMTSNVTGIGNYKGIMLCNRPVSSSAELNHTSDTKKFVCGLVPEPSGLSVSILSKERVKTKKDKSNSVLTKHRKWLQELQKEKDRLEIEAEIESQRKEAIAKKLADSACKQRYNISDTKEVDESKPETDSNISSDLSSILKFNDDGAAAATTTNNEKRSSSSISSIPSTLSADSKSVKMTRPAWALTSDVTKSIQESKESEDIDDLLDFAQTVDYNKYINDIEIKVMVEQMKKRISELEKDIEEDNKRIGDDLEIKDLTSKLEKLGEFYDDHHRNYSFQSDEKQESKNSSSAVLAKNLLDHENDLYNVHSMRSVNAIIKSTMDAAAVSAVNNEAQPKVYNEPKTVTHDADGSDGSRINRVDVSNLPYLHRNPAV